MGWNVELGACVPIDIQRIDVVRASGPDARLMDDLKFGERMSGPVARILLGY
jgi:hypothetical protein